MISVKECFFVHVPKNWNKNYETACQTPAGVQKVFRMNRAMFVLSHKPVWYPHEHFRNYLRDDTEKDSI